MNRTAGCSWITPPCQAPSQKAPDLPTHKVRTFELDYGSGDNDLLTVTLVTLNPDAAEPTLSLKPSPDGWVLEYTGQLVSSTEVQGDYQPVPGASSPYLLTPGEPQRFYRAVR